MSAIMVKKEVFKLAENFEVKKYSQGDADIISTPIENIVRVKNDENGYTISRTLIGTKDSSTTKTSKKYHIVSDGEILKGMFSNSSFEEAFKDLEDIEFVRDGGFDMHFDKCESDFAVLDWIDGNYVKKPFGLYSKTVSVTNSYNKVRAVRIVTGIFRDEKKAKLVSGFKGARIKHLSCNEDKLNDNIAELIGMVPVFAKDDIFNELVKKEFNADLKSKLNDALSSYFNGKLNTKTVSANVKLQEVVKVVSKFILEAIPHVDNMLDMENILSYIGGSAFHKSLVVIIRNKVNMVFKKAMAN